MSTTENIVLPQVSEATLISITCRIELGQPIKSIDIRRRSQLEEDIASFSKETRHVPDPLTAGDEDPEDAVKFDKCFGREMCFAGEDEYVKDDEEMIDCEAWLETYWWAQELLSSEVETLHGFWMNKIKELSKLNKDELKWEIKQLQKRLSEEA